MCISAGASVSGASWKTISMPSIVCASTAFTIDWVGAIRPGVPRATLLPRPASTWPRAPRGSIVPNWNCARRPIGGPASTFSPEIASMKPAGAITRTFPAFTSASSTTPRTPP